MLTASMFIMLFSLFTPAGAVAQTLEATPGASPVVSEGGWRITDTRSIEDIGGWPSALSPDGVWLAGISSDGFCVWDVEMLERTCAGDSPGSRDTGSIVWAPDSTAVAFSYYSPVTLTQSFDVDSDLYLFDLTSMRLVNLTDDGYEGDLFADDIDNPPPVDTMPAWSPDSSQLAFVRSSIAGQVGGGSTTLMRIDRTGGEPTEIVQVDGESAGVVSRTMYWLPDDTLLYLYLSHDVSLSSPYDPGPDANSPDRGVWQVGIDGSDRRQIVKNAPGAGIHVGSIASVSPDGTIAVLRADVAEEVNGDVPGTPALSLLDIANGGTTSIDTPGDDRVAALGFSPDGASVLVGYEDRSSGYLVRLAVLDVASGTLEVVGHVDQELWEWGAHPNWSAGTKVFYPSGASSFIVTLERGL